MATPNLVSGWRDGVPGSVVPLSVGALGGINVRLAGTVIAGQATVATAGAAVCLGTAALISGVSVKAMNDNAGTVFVGGFAVSSTVGYELNVNESVFVEVDALDEVWVDATSNGDKVSYIGG